MNSRPPTRRTPILFQLRNALGKLPQELVVILFHFSRVFQ